MSERVSKRARTIETSDAAAVGRDYGSRNRQSTLASRMSLDSLSVRVLHAVFDHLDILELLRLARLNRRWLALMDDERFWTTRVIQDLGYDRYVELLRDSSSVVRSSCWSARQHLLWELVARATADQPPSQRFDVQRQLWIGIMIQRKRLFQRKSNTAENSRISTSASNAFSSAGTSMSASSNSSS